MAGRWSQLSALSCRFSRRRGPVYGPVLAALCALAVLPASASAGPVTFGTITVDDVHQHVFVSVPSADQVDEFDFSGHLIDTVAKVYGASGMVISGPFLYVAERTAGQIVRIDLLTSTLLPVPVVSGLNGPSTLTVAGGRLWTALEGDYGLWTQSIVSVDPITGTVNPLPVRIDFPMVASSPGTPDTLYVIERGQSPGQIYEYNVATSPPTQLLNVSILSDANIQDVAISADGSRVIPAAGWPYEFDEFSASTLEPDGLVYPAQPYPQAVAVSASGLLATGLHLGSPNIVVYPLGRPQAIFSAATPGNSTMPHGLALSADGSVLFAVVDNGAGDLSFDTFSLNSPTPNASAALPTSTATTSTTSADTTSTAATTSPTTTSMTTTTRSVPVPATIVPTTSTLIASGPSLTSPAPTTRTTLARVTRQRSVRTRARPYAAVTLGAIRSPLLSARTHKLRAYRYFFDASHIRCLGHADGIVFSVAGVRRRVACRAGTVVVSRAVQPDRRYLLTVVATDSRSRSRRRHGLAHVVPLRIGPAARWVVMSALPQTGF